MTCPYFMPLEKLENGKWPHPARLPLGGGWTGHCTAPGHEGQLPSQDVVEAFCNLGYATTCAWTPEHRSCDAVRFAVAASLDARGARKSFAGEAPVRLLRLSYVCERDHHPSAHGELEFDLARATWVVRHDDPRIQKMAECFLESYLQKKA